MFTRKPEEHGCVLEFKELMDIIMEQEGLQMPSFASEAKNLYTALMHHIAELNNHKLYTNNVNNLIGLSARYVTGI